MRSVSGPRNRLALVVAGVLALLAAAWIGAAGLGLTARWPRAEVVLPHGDSTPTSLAAAHEAWLLPVAVAAGVLALVLGIWLLLAQIPSRTSTPALRLRDGEGAEALLGTLEPAVLERALSEHAEEVSGVVDASVRISGAASAPWVQASVTIAEEAETAWAVDAVRELLAEDVRTVLGAPVRSVDLLVHLRSAAAPSRAVLTGADPVTARPLQPS